MNAREAKKQAYLRAAGMLDTAFSGSDASYLDDIYGERDAEKVSQGIWDIISMLRERARDRG